MRKIRRYQNVAWALVICMMVSFISPKTFAQEQAKISASTSSQMQQKAELLVKQYGITSVQYALLDEGKITHASVAGVYSKAENKMLTNNQMYTIASVSKMYTAAAVMKLVDMGKLDLDIPLTTYIPEFKMADERYKKITPRMLLNHSSGIMMTGLENTILFQDIDSQQHDAFLQQLQKATLKLEPGAYSVYCNDGFTLAEILVERVSNMSFTNFMHQYFTQPLGLENTKTPQDKIDFNNVVKGYLPSYAGELLTETPNIIGAGGIYSTAQELCKFSQIFMKDSKGILSPKSVEAMTQKEYAKGLWVPESDNNSIGFGLGWDAVELYPFNEYGIKALVKGGDLYTQHASVIVLPEYNLSATVLTSGGSGIINQMLATQMLLETLKEKGIIKEIKPIKTFTKPIEAPMPQELRQHQGVYGNYSSMMKVDITTKSALSIDMGIPGYPASAYTYTKDGTFTSEDGATKVKFKTEKNNKTYLWMQQYITVPGIGQCVLTQYAGQKMEENKLPPELQTAWEKRNGKIYYIANEKYSSEMYLLQAGVPVRLDPNVPGYIGNSKITGINTTKTELEIPMIMGRDLPDLTFYEEDGTEYLKLRSSIYVSQDTVKPLDTTKNLSIQIDNSGYTKWYSTSEQDAGKTMKIESPVQSSVIIYDEKGSCIYNKYLVKGETITLPQQGLIAFVGPSNTEFKISYLK
ncbi:MAG: serine hydrolase domain-containing protein [Cellulosilyticaceae bacterium]